MSSLVMGLLGGMLIGISGLLLLFFNGRILGVSGILSGVFRDHTPGRIWRYSFLVGMMAGGCSLLFISPAVFSNTVVRSWRSLALAGLLVGFGTSMANGCTSGHGVCGISRLSKRSILATLIFIGFGALTVFVMSPTGAK